MNWHQRFARRTAHMRRNAVRELLKITSRPDIISFAGGLPAAELFPLDRIQDALETIFKSIGNRSLQYAETEGIAGLRAWIAGQFSRAQFPVEPENVLITSGAQQALDLIGRVFLDPGDPVVVENPTYLALLSAWRPFEVQFHPVAADVDGLDVAALERELRLQPKLIYAVPNFQNPRGTTLALERRHALAACLREHEVVLVEDNPYGELRYEGTPLPHVFELNARRSATGDLDTQVIYTGTFSKILMPGLRLGWVIAASEVIDKLIQAKQAADLHSNTLSQYLAIELVGHRFLDEHLPRLRQAYCARRDAMLQALETHFPKTITWTRPEGGMFLLVELPAGWDASVILPMALEHKVAFVPGEEFHLNGQGKNTMRLNFSNAPPDRIEEGVNRLAAVMTAVVS